MLVLLLVSIQAIYVLNRYSAVSKNQHQITAAFQSTNAIVQIKSLIGDGAAWQNTLSLPANATTFSCLNTPGNCAASMNNGAAAPPSTTAFPTSMGGASFQLVDRSNIVFYDSTNLSAGFGLDGAPCTGFSTVSPNSNCPFRVVLYWFPDPLTCGAASVCKAYYVAGYTLYSAQNGTNSDHAFNSFNPQYSFGPWHSPDDSILKGSGYCCQIRCDHLADDTTSQGEAYVLARIVEKGNCFPGSREIPNDICDNSLGPNGDWAPAGLANYVPVEVPDISICP